MSKNTHTMAADAATWVPRTRGRIGFMVVLVSLTSPQAAELPVTDVADSLSAPPASVQELEELRGGFTFANGMRMDFSIDRSTAINGEAQFASHYQLPAGFSLDDLRAANRDGTSGRDSVAALRGLQGMATVIQNRLDNQFINNLTTLNINLSNLRGMTAQGAGPMYQPMDTALLR
ncbi:MAG: hypothetical protein ACK443_06800 [Methylococcaceae bacterium]|jgi:hypothetical protein